ncbi:hypothetical protein X801_05781 [Opisthorchis viverrini]|uniref:Tropomyosin n=1 Tax=Opisthorchis viverrini TaxID=6198 RepID=A0A1S8WV70_OPIVI|nr:hypothetical protein X801_05781 [Opisthorchis viverrini]
MEGDRIVRLTKLLQHSTKEAILENRTIADEERINQLEEQLKEATFMAEDADRKYDEVMMACAACVCVCVFG